MNKKIKIIELLNLLAENSIKKGTRINYNNVIYKVDFPNLAGVYKENGGTSLYDNLFTSLDIIELNTEVEILEDEEDNDISSLNAFKLMEAPYMAKCLDKNSHEEFMEHLKQSEVEIVHKIGELIEKVNKIDRKINKED